MTRRKWRVSDVFTAISLRDPNPNRSTYARTAAMAAQVDHRAGRLRDDTIGHWLRGYLCAAFALGYTYSAWINMTDEERCAAVVRAARRFRVKRC